MAPSTLQIATSSLSRLLTEEKSYFTELNAQQKRILALERASAQNEPEPEDEKGNRAFTLKQEKQALDETKKVLPSLRERITSAREKLESVLDTSTNEAELEKAKEVLALAKEQQKHDPDSAKPEEEWVVV